MAALQNLLEIFRSHARSAAEAGAYFEQLCRLYLTHEPFYADLYKSVVKASKAEIPGFYSTGGDIGIDLIAELRNPLPGQGKYHAVQCKFYDPDSYVSKKEIDSFFSASVNSEVFSGRLIISTTDKFGGNFDVTVKNAEKSGQPVEIIRINDLKNSRVNWSAFTPENPSSEKISLRERKELRPHQEIAVNRVLKGFEGAGRGKLIMACGTGKTFTALKIAETVAGAGKKVLFLVPSLALLSQTLTEWTQESKVPLRAFAVCSDADVGKKRGNDEESDGQVKLIAHELPYPASTDAESLKKHFKAATDEEHMAVVFSTYHSLEVVHKAQIGADALPDFDLIVCDEAHRTTGAVFVNEDESAFVRVHNGDFIKGAKRLYMTATPKIYTDAAKVTASEGKAELYSMDDERLFGKTFHVLNFSEAVKRGLLTDYKVVVLAVSEDHIARNLRKFLSEDGNTLNIDDASRIVGSWKALSKQDFKDKSDTAPMKRALAFCQVIEPYNGKKKVSSKLIAKEFANVVEAYQEEVQKDLLKSTEAASSLICEVKHVDGSMNATEKTGKINWLKEDTSDDVCRILSNVRCLSEGVDVPALDAVIFLTPRSSQVDVVQSVGRVMRNAPGKQKGYVILPVVIPAGKDPNEVLENNQSYRVVWQVLQALRSHDDSFDALVNKLAYKKHDLSRMEVIAVSDKISPKQRALRNTSQSRRGNKRLREGGENPEAFQEELDFEITDLEMAIYAKIVEKCGNRRHIEDWADDVGRIAKTYISTINDVLADENSISERAAFEGFLTGLHKNLNNEITRDEAIEMLAQHQITKPVFDALFEGYSFTDKNPVSKAMNETLSLLETHRFKKETESLQGFYESVKMRVSGVKGLARQNIIKDLYDKFFRKAFPKMSDRLGIVYTPVEVIDFIIKSTDEVLRQEFGASLSDKAVHILDPFTGTGSFITRLLQSELIRPEDLERKYTKELHANEIVLLAYYIAAINIEETYHELSAKIAGQLAKEEQADYLPFEGIVLTDTFKMTEKKERLDGIWAPNSVRAEKQNTADIRVIIGNPPYSAGQASANDNNKNTDYPFLDNRIKETYVLQSNASLKNSLYDSYVRAIRWASDRVKDKGLIAFVTNGGFVDGKSFDGFRKCLLQEFSSVYCFNLRGDMRSGGGSSIFGTTTSVAILILVKNPETVSQEKTQGRLFYYDLGDGLTPTEKLKEITCLGSLKTVDWQEVIPDSKGKWVNFGDSDFESFLPLGNNKDKAADTVFNLYSLGIATNRDIWVYNSSDSELSNNMKNMVEFYNSEVERYAALPEPRPKADGFVDYDLTKISWTMNLKKYLHQGKRFNFDDKFIVKSFYRPFFKQYLYFNRYLSEAINQLPQIFPTSNLPNITICIPGVGDRRGFCALITNNIPSYDLFEKIRLFSFYIYERQETLKKDQLFDEPVEGKEKPLELITVQDAVGNSVTYAKYENISDKALAMFRKRYGGALNKEDIFYGIYGIFHHPEYTARFQNNVRDELARVPPVKDFSAFVKAGRALADLHLNYETLTPYPLQEKITAPPGIKPSDLFAVTSQGMKFAKNGKEKDLSTLIFNPFITLYGIPPEAHEYRLNGRSALEWLINRYKITIDKESNLSNNPNLYSDNPRYIFDLVKRIITLSVETRKIITSLPPLEITGNWEKGE